MANYIQLASGRGCIALASGRGLMPLNGDGSPSIISEVRCDLSKAEAGPTDSVVECTPKALVDDANADGQLLGTIGASS